MASAMRLALMRLRCGNFVSSAAASMGARGQEIRQVIGPATPRVPLLPSLRPAAARNLEGLRHFSTECMEEVGQNKPLLMKHKAGRILHMWWQRSIETLKKDIERPHSILVYTGCATMICSSVSFAWSILRSRSTDNRAKPVHSGTGMQAPMLGFMIPSFSGSRSIYRHPVFPRFMRTYTYSAYPSFWYLLSLDHECATARPVRYARGGTKSAKTKDRS